GRPRGRAVERVARELGQLAQTAPRRAVVSQRVLDLAAALRGWPTRRTRAGRAVDRRRRDGLRRREQRRRAGTVELRLAAGGEEREHVLALLARGVGNGHEPLGEQVAALALGAKAALAPQHERAELTLGVVVGRLDAV